MLPGSLLIDHQHIRTNARHRYSETVTDTDTPVYGFMHAEPPTTTTKREICTTNNIKKQKQRQQLKVAGAVDKVF